MSMRAKIAAVYSKPGCWTKEELEERYWKRRYVANMKLSPNEPIALPKKYTPLVQLFVDAGKPFVQVMDMVARTPFLGKATGYVSVFAIGMLTTWTSWYYIKYHCIPYTDRFAVQKGPQYPNREISHH